MIKIGVQIKLSSELTKAMDGALTAWPMHKQAPEWQSEGGKLRGDNTANPSKNS